MRRFVVVVAICWVLGCGSNRGIRPLKEKPQEQTVIEPSAAEVVTSSITIAGDITEAQRKQIRNRALGMRELAKQYRDGTVKDIWDAHKTYLDFDKRTRAQFEDALRGRIEKDFKREGDILPDNSEELFNAIADEFDAVLK